MTPGEHMVNIFCFLLLLFFIIIILYLIVADINECSTNNGGCSQTCTNTQGSFTCSCSSGYQLSGNGLSCVDINECTTSQHNCAQVCRNTPGSFTCDCNSGFMLNSDQRTCSGEIIAYLVNVCNHRPFKITIFS